uniref:Uncharacterized protein n=1 Tax=Anopheles atroparvus TaxID=41427 RepID=A0A182IKD7_ANOAO
MSYARAVRRHTSYRKSLLRRSIGHSLTLTVAWAAYVAKQVNNDPMPQTTSRWRACRPCKIECTVFSLQPISPSQVNARLMFDDQLDGERPELADNGVPLHFPLLPPAFTMHSIQNLKPITDSKLIMKEYKW